MAPLSKEIRVTVRALHSLHPSWTSREIGGIVGKNCDWVRRWWERDNEKNKRRGNTIKQKLSEQDLQFIPQCPQPTNQPTIQKKMKGTKKKSGDERLRLMLKVVLYCFECLVRICALFRGVCAS